MSVFVSRRLYMSEGVSIFVHHCQRAYLLLHPCLCVCPALWWRLLALTILRRGRRHFSQWQAAAHAGWPGVSRLIASGRSLYALLLHLCFHRPRSLQEPRQRNVLAARAALSFCVLGWGPRQKHRHAEAKFNWCICLHGSIVDTFAQISELV